MNWKTKSILPFILLLYCFSFLNVSAQNELKPYDLLALKRVNALQISPDGENVLYAIYTPRTANEKPGGAHVEYKVMSLKDNSSTPLLDKEIKISSPIWSPDGKSLAFIHKKENEKSQVWVIPAEGGEMKQLTKDESGVTYFRWNPNGKGIAYLAKTPKLEKEKELDNRGYGFIFYEENLKKVNLFNLAFDISFSQINFTQLTKDINVWDFEFNKQGTQIALSTSEEPLIDQKYMFRKLQIIDIASGAVIHNTGNEGKLGNYVFSPDGKNLAFTSALNINDHAVSQVYKYSLTSKQTTNLTPLSFKGHITWASWKNDEELVFYSGESVYPKINVISASGGERTIILDSEKSGIIFGTPLISDDFKKFVFTGSTPIDASNMYVWNGADDLNKITDINPELSTKTLGEQEVFTFSARDGLKIEGILIKPVGFKKDEKYPLILFVHGGPESHHSNGWLSRYSTPGQVMTGKGYMVAYINYRASTGYGVDFGMEGFGDPAGKEFDDLADAIDFLTQEKGADKERVGLAGGSYGGYAAAWFATYYTKYVKAVGMFVGISDLISKRGTTDIAYEELYVHSGKPLEEQWQMNLERSPIYYAHQSKTATLIYGGAADPRVHPTQSYELYRRMKMNNHPAVRLVQYPGEGHGNRKQVGQIDVLLRQIDWFDWYVKELRPIDGPMPALDISCKYGLNWDY